jgi:hypothetical protein
VPDTRYNLTAGGSVTLDSTGVGTVTLGPDSGPANWRVTGLIVQTNRPGQAPVPRVQIYLDQVDPSNSQGLNYDGSFAQATGEVALSRGSHLIAVWSGGQAGDRATITATGEKWN